MAVGGQRGDAPARGALQVALLDQVGLDHILNGFALFTNARSNVVQPNRAAVKAVNDRLQQLAVHQIEPLRIDIEHGERAVGDLQRDLPEPLTSA